MEKALVISLNFNPGHVSHLEASYRQMEELGYESIYCVSESFVNYLPAGSRLVCYGRDGLPEASVAIFLFPSHRNLLLIRRLKRRGTKIIYIFHEPLSALKDYRRAGFSYKYLAKLRVVDRVSSLTVKWSDAIILPSRKAVALYNANPLYKNAKSYYIPLLYADERTENPAPSGRQFFSYIGTIAADHSFNEYLEFVRYAIKEDRLPGLSFMIATKSGFVAPPDLEESPRVVFKTGRPMDNAQINECYASSYVVWNAYARTTQSGVLAKSFMFGTPAIVLRNNLSEFTEDGKEVVAIEDNTSFSQIESAISRITSSFQQFSDAARRRFEDTFLYRNYNDGIKEILSSL